MWEERQRDVIFDVIELHRVLDVEDRVSWSRGILEQVQILVDVNLQPDEKMLLREVRDVESSWTTTWN